MPQITQLLSTIPHPLTLWEILIILAFTIAVFLCITLYLKSAKTKLATQQKDAAQKALHEYITHIEQRQTDIRKFKHDYNNILTAINGFIADQDLNGLKQYLTKVRAASATATRNEFALEGLSKIKSPEIKGLLVQKIMEAQHKNIPTTFEAHEEIANIPVDSVALVRMLGIIMDNAIEELAALDAGYLAVACYKHNGATVFTVQNTCRENIPKPQELKQAGFSTKGSGRGIGLCNLDDLVAAHSTNLVLQTNITDRSFTQKLLIGGA